MEWVDINERKPEKAGWYKIKMSEMRQVEYEAPYIHNGKGDLVWVVPDETLITHQKEIARNEG